MQTNEAALIAQSLDGDTAAYGQLVDRYKQAIYHHCFAIVRDPDSAEDLAQETFITAYYKLKSYKSRYKFSTWLFKIATNKCLNQLRSQKRHITDDGVLENHPSDQATPRQAAEYAELHQAVRTLSAKQRSVISLYYWQGLSYEEIAVAMGSPVNSVRVWLLRAKQQLRKELA